MNLTHIDLKFIEKGHKHILNGEEVPGCSTIAKMFDTGEWRCAWAAKMMYLRIKRDLWDRPDRDGHDLIHYETAMYIVEKAKNAWREKRDSTADIGTAMHKNIELYIKERLSGRAPAEAAPALIASSGKEFALNVIQFLDWERKGNIKWLAAELQVGSVKHQYAGIFDCLYEMGGKVYLDDVKTSEKTKDDWMPQLVGLKYALAEQGQEVDGLGILHMPRDGSFKRIPIDCDYEREFRAFLMAKDFYKERCLWEARHKQNDYFYKKARAA